MKKLLLVIIALMSVTYSNVLGNDNSIIADAPRSYRGINVQDYTIKGNGEECWFLYDLDSSKISRSDCLSLTNSKGVEIFCTSKKKMCKTKQELYAFIKGIGDTKKKMTPQNDNSIIADVPRTYRGTNVQDYTIKGNGEECWILYDLDSSKISRSDCLSITNSKGVEIFCTAKKKMCKTKQELYAFIEGNGDTKKKTTPQTKNTFTNQKMGNNIKAWQKAGIPLNDISRWKDLGINSPAEAKQWVDMHFSAKIVLRLHEDGINSPAEAKQWKDAVNDIFEIYLWKRAGINSPAEAKTWKDAGFYANDIIYWKKAGISPTEAKEWLDMNIQYTTVSELKKVGINSPAKAKVWRDAGFNTDNTINWKKEGVTSPNEAKQWRDVGIAFYSINPLKKVGVNSPDEVLQWNRIGIPPKEVVMWKDAGITLLEAEKMKKLGASYRILGYLKKEGIVTADEYRIFDSSEKNVKKMCSASLTRYGINCPVETFREAINKGCNEVEVLKTGLLQGKYIPFSESDPYENENKCYIFAADLSQRLDRNHGLFSGDNGSSYLEIPAGRYSEGTTYIGVVRGKGEYKYETIYGDTRIISKGKVLSITH